MTGVSLAQGSTLRHYRDFSIIVAGLIMAFFGETITTWRAALLAGYSFDSTLQKLSTGTRRQSKRPSGIDAGPAVRSPRLTRGERLLVHHHGGGGGSPTCEGWGCGWGQHCVSMRSNSALTSLLHASMRLNHSSRHFRIAGTEFGMLVHGNCAAFFAVFFAAFFFVAIIPRCG